MGRILAMDYGMKRTGLAVTDPLKIIATGLTTVDTPQLFNFLKDYVKKEVVDLFLIGEPRNLDDSDTHITQQVASVILRLKKEFPQIPVQGVDERYTSKMASRAMVEMGMKKKQRRDKKIIDEIAATIMLQEYLQQGTF
jgi:putative holliday junction resolvase